MNQPVPYTNGRWPQWIQTSVAVLAVIASVFTAYFTLDKRIALLEQKIDFVIQMVKKP